MRGLVPKVAVPGRAYTRSQKRRMLARRMLARLLRAWDAAPDLRLGQFLVNAVTPPGSEPAALIFYVEDERLCELAEAFAHRLPPR